MFEVTEIGHSSTALRAVLRRVAGRPGWEVRTIIGLGIRVRYYGTDATAELSLVLDELRVSGDRGQVARVYSPEDAIDAAHRLGGPPARPFRAQRLRPSTIAR